MDTYSQEPQQQSLHSNNSDLNRKLSLQAYQVAMATLASATRCKPFSRDDCAVWYKFLSGYADDVLIEAVETFCRGTDAFPMPGKLIAICKQIVKHRQELSQTARIAHVCRTTGGAIPYPGSKAARMLAASSTVPEQNS